MSTKQKKTIQKGSFKRLLKLFFFKNKMLTALMLFSIIISAVATALGPQYVSGVCNGFHCTGYVKPGKQ